MDEKQFVNLVVVNKSKLARYGWYYLKNIDDVNDTLQDLFVRLWKMRFTLANYDSVLALSMTMMRNMCFDKLRKQKGLVNLSIDQLPDIIDFSPNENQSTEITKLYLEINKLTGLQKEIITLKDIEGYDYQEICQILDLEIGAVRTNLCRARQKIRDRIIKNRENGC